MNLPAAPGAYALIIVLAGRSGDLEPQTIARALQIDVQEPGTLPIPASAIT